MVGRKGGDSGGCTIRAQGRMSREWRRRDRDETLLRGPARYLYRVFCVAPIPVDLEMPELATPDDT